MEEHTKIDQSDANLINVAEIELAVARGIRLAVSDPRLWEAAGIAMREHATSTAGGWLIGGAMTIVKRIAWVGVVFSGVYLLGGWGAVVALMKAQGAHA